MLDGAAATLIGILWLAWLAYWIIAARSAKPRQREESIGSRLTHVILFAIVGIILTVPRLPIDWLNDRFMPPSRPAYWVGTALVACGLGFTVWARRHLGSNWSGRVALMADHELIRSGPYGLVRHPIYSGLLLAIFGTALAFGRWREVLAFLFAALAVWRKSRLEEAYLLELFPSTYPNYQAEVPPLIPFILPRRPPSTPGSNPPSR